MDRCAARRLVDAEEGLVASANFYRRFARQNPEATRVATPPKALDQLLSNSAPQLRFPGALWHSIETACSFCGSGSVLPFQLCPDTRAGVTGGGTYVFEAVDDLF